MYLKVANGALASSFCFVSPFFSSTRDEGEDRDWREKMGLEDDCLHFQLLLAYKK